MPHPSCDPCCSTPCCCSGSPPDDLLLALRGFAGDCSGWGSDCNDLNGDFVISRYAPALFPCAYLYTRGGAVCYFTDISAYWTNKNELGLIDGKCHFRIYLYGPTTPDDYVWEAEFEDPVDCVIDETGWDVPLVWAPGSWNLCGLTPTCHVSAV